MTVNQHVQYKNNTNTVITITGHKMNSHEQIKITKSLKKTMFNKPQHTVETRYKGFRHPSTILDDLVGFIVLTHLKNLQI